LFRQGVIDALRSDEVDVEAPADLGRWAAQGGRRIVVLTLGSSADWSLLEQVSPQSSVIAVLEENTADLAIRALRMGAESVVARSATVPTLRRAVEAVLAGDTIVSRSVVRSLVASSRLHQGNTPRLPETEMHWLRELASGVTVARLASQAGYSERAMYRLLNGIYDRLGVTNRTEALIKANAYGWLGTETR
jgi:DNA-binding NarL/FixJ family response regulator